MIFLWVNCTLVNTDQLVHPQGCQTPHSASAQHPLHLLLAHTGKGPCQPLTLCWHVPPAGNWWHVPPSLPQQGMENSQWLSHAKMWGNPWWRPGKSLLFATESELVLKDFLSHLSICLITAIATTVNSWWTCQHILIEYIEHTEQNHSSWPFP